MLEFELFWIVVFGIHGAIFGSFATVIAHRVPREESIVLPPSHCPACRRGIQWHENIPVLSYLLLKGRCKGCGIVIPARYLAIELASVAVFVTAFKLAGEPIPGGILALALWLFYVNAVIDAEHMGVPDSISLLAFMTAIIAPMGLEGVLEAARNGFIFAGFAAFIRVGLSYILKKEALGEGDILVFGTIGALCGLQGGVAALTIASLAMVVFSILSAKDRPVPFVPFLFVGAMVSLIASASDLF